MTAGPSLHIARDSTGVDIAAAERAAAGFLAALGIDVEHEDMQETPARMARAYAELFSPAVTTRSCSAVTWTGASSSPSGWARGAFWPA
jgi:GTP cyclohydrolase I